jgi:hypothetical protein
MNKILFPLFAVPFFIVGCGAPETPAVSHSDTAATATEQPVLDTVAEAEEVAPERITNFVIENASIGPIAVGATYDMLVNIFGDELVQSATREAEGEEYEIWEILHPSGAVAFELDLKTTEGPEENETSVGRITTYDGTYKTTEGIGVGSSYAQIKAAHPAFTVIGGIPGVMIYPAEHSSVAYILNVPDYEFGSEMEPTSANIPDRALVTSVYTYAE